MLQIKGMSLSVGQFKLNEINLEVEKNDYMVVLGRTGAGKSILLEVVAGHYLPDIGSIYLNGKEITQCTMTERRVGMVYQEAYLFPHMTVQENIEFAFKNGRTPEHEKGLLLDELSEVVGLKELLSRNASEISGGEAQLTAIARAMAARPDIMLLDEPISSLDTEKRNCIMAVLRRLHRSGMTMVHVTHDYAEALALATRVAAMDEGRILQSGDPVSVFSSPKSTFIASLTGRRNCFMGEVTVYPENSEELFCLNTGKTGFCLPGPIPTSATGHVSFRAEDVTVGLIQPDSSALNTFQGKVVDAWRNQYGVEIVVDAGVQIVAFLTPQSARKMNLKPGRKVWVSVKAAALQFVEGMS